MAANGRSEILKSLGGIVAVAGVAGAVLWGYSRFSEPPQSARPAAHDIIFGGDVMLGRNVGHWMAQGAGPFDSIAGLLRGADQVVINLEAPLTDATSAVEKDIVLKASPDAVSVLSDAGVSVATLANNHTFDYGLEGFIDTREVLDGAGIAHTGAGEDLAEATTPVLFDGGGNTVALLAFSKWDTETVPAATDSSFGQASIDNSRYEASIDRAARTADLVVVALHFGSEYQLDYSDAQQDAAQRAITAGADLVIGHHPHVSQPLSVIDGVPVFYSLGNLVFDQETPPRDRSFLVGLDIHEGRFDFTLYPYRIYEGEVDFMSAADGKSFLHALDARESIPGLILQSDGTATFSVSR